MRRCPFFFVQYSRFLFKKRSNHDAFGASIEHAYMLFMDREINHFVMHCMTFLNFSHICARSLCRQESFCNCIRIYFQYMGLASKAIVCEMHKRRNDIRKNKPFPFNKDQIFFFLFLFCYTFFCQLTDCW